MEHRPFRVRQRGSGRAIFFMDRRVSMDRSKKRLYLFALILLTCFLLLIGRAQEAKKLPKNYVVAKPDLTVKIQAPTTVTPGAQMGQAFNIQVKNQGLGPAKNISLDIILSSDKIDPMRPAPFKRLNQYLKHWERSIRELKAGESTNVSFPGNNKIPDRAPLGKYWLAAAVDRMDTIDETNEKNNLAVHELLIIANIQAVTQHHYGCPTAELDISGQGFGATAGSKQVYIGANPASSVIHWSPTGITVVAPQGIPYGKDYTVTIKQGTITLSNAFNFLLRMWIEAVEPEKGPPGTAITLWGFQFGNSQGPKVLKLGTQTLNVTSWQNSQIQATIPNNASPGTHTLTIREGMKLISSSQTSFTVQ